MEIPMRLSLNRFIAAAGAFFIAITASTLDAQTRVAIPPFDNITKNTEYDWLCNGFSETLTTGLSEVNSVIIIERSQFTALVKEQDLQLSDLSDATKAVSVGKVLGAEKMLLGSFQVFGQKIKVNARIVDVSTGEVDRNHILMAEDEINKVFDIYNQIVEKALQSFGINVSQSEKSKIASSTKGTSDLESYENYIKGVMVYSTSGTEKEYKEAIDLFNKSIEKDPNYALAYTGLAKSYAKLGRLKEVSFKFDEKIADYQNAAKYGSKAVQLNRELSSAWTALALIYRELKQRDKLITAARKAIQFKPTEYEAYDILADAFTKHFFPDFYHLDSAIYFRKKSVEIEPKFAGGYRGLGSDYFVSGDLDNAEAAFKQAVEILPKHSGGHDLLGQVYFQKGQFDKAKQEFNQKIVLDPKSAFGYTHLADVLFVEGNFTEAFLKYTYAIEINPNAAYAYNSLAWMYLTAKDEKFRNAGKSIEYGVSAIGYTNFKNAEYLYVAAESYFAASKRNKVLADTALTYIKQAIGLDPDNQEYLEAMARFMNKEKNSEYVYDLKRGESYLKYNRVNDAIRELEESYKHNPEYIPTMLALSKAYAKFGDSAKANEKMELAKKKDKAGKYAKFYK
jgi:tetratricopeptide (TPR) repeat protein